MTTVFIGGSRAVSKLNALIRARLKNLIQKGCQILVGDANGADMAVQQFLADRGYSKVTVFSMDACRNNIGSWETRKIQAASARRDFAYYALKDVAMAHGAKCGVMLWDGGSKGTLHNVLNLIGAGKKVLVYFSPEKAFYKLSTPQDLDSLLARSTVQLPRHPRSTPASDSLPEARTHASARCIENYKWRGFCRCMIQGTQ